MDSRFELKPVQNRGAQLLVRLLISSYFIAMATGILPYENGRALMEMVFATPYASFVFTGFVFTAAYLILLGKHVRIAALLLSVFVFWASYIANFGPGKILDLQGFWSDLALIGALMLTAAEGDSSRTRSIKTRIGRAIKPRRVRPTLQNLTQSAPNDTQMADAHTDNDNAHTDDDNAKTGDDKVVPLSLVNNSAPVIEFQRHRSPEAFENDLERLPALGKSGLA